MYRYQLPETLIRQGYQSENKILVFEDSELSTYPCEHVYSSDRLGITAIQIENTDAKNIMTFFFDYYDMQNGEIMGTNYKSKSEIKLLIIND